MPMTDRKSRNFCNLSCGSTTNVTAEDVSFPVMLLCLLSRDADISCSRLKQAQSQAYLQTVSPCPPTHSLFSRPSLMYS